MRNLSVWFAFCGLIAVSLVPSAEAARFANQFVEFELPPKWQCNLEGAEWVCQSAEPKEKRNAIIVLAAKMRGDQDSTDQYLAYLKQSKTYTSVQGKPVKSEMRTAKTTSINDHIWVDSLHFESEIPGFYTRYLATTKSDIGVLVTYSIVKDKYQQYLNEFEAMVKTLKVFRKTGGLNVGSKEGSLFSATSSIPSHITSGSVFGTAGTESGGEESGGQTPAKEEDDLWLYLLIGAGIVGFIIWRRRQAG